jgi:tripartite-type tricarboxylate transporter receptor subunit TctC
MKVLFAAASLLACSLALPATQASADEWPTKFVRVVVSGGAGGSGDVLGRMLAEQLSASLKQQFVVENRVGAGGTIGTQSMASSPPDGYTIGITLLSTVSLAPVIMPSVAYNGLNDFTHIAYIAGAPVLLGGNPKTNVKTLPEFVRYAQEKMFTFATAGVGTDGHLMGELIAQSLKLKTEHVPYKSAAQGVTDVVAGHVPFSTLTLASAGPFVRSNQMNGVALTSSERMADYPDLPTFKELGYPEVTGTTWYLLSGPPNLPPDVVAKLNREVGAIMTKPEVQARMRRDGFITEQMTPVQVKDFVAKENARWKQLIDSIGLANKG